MKEGSLLCLKVEDMEAPVLKVKKHLTPHPILLTRHGESRFNVRSRIGGDSIISVQENSMPRNLEHLLKTGLNLNELPQNRGLMQKYANYCLWLLLMCNDPAEPIGNAALNNFRYGLLLYKNQS